MKRNLKKVAFFYCQKTATAVYACLTHPAGYGFFTTRHYTSAKFILTVLVIMIVFLGSYMVVNKTAGLGEQFDLFNDELSVTINNRSDYDIVSIDFGHPETLPGNDVRLVQEDIVNMTIKAGDKVTVEPKLITYMETARRRYQESRPYKASSETLHPPFGSKGEVFLFKDYYKL